MSEKSAFLLNIAFFLGSLVLFVLILSQLPTVGPEQINKNLEQCISNPMCIGMITPW